MRARLKPHSGCSKAPCVMGKLSSWCRDNILPLWVHYSRFQVLSLSGLSSVFVKRALKSQLLINKAWAPKKEGLAVQWLMQRFQAIRIRKRGMVQKSIGRKSSRTKILTSLPLTAHCHVKRGNTVFTLQQSFRRVKPTPDPNTLKSIAIHLPFLSRYFCKSMPSSWQKVVYTPPICITIRLPCVSRCFCGIIRVRGLWNMSDSRDHPFGMNFLEILSTCHFSILKDKAPTGMAPTQAYYKEAMNLVASSTGPYLASKHRWESSTASF